MNVTREVPDDIPAQTPDGVPVLLMHRQEDALVIPPPIAAALRRYTEAKQTWDKAADEQHAAQKKEFYARRIADLAQRELTSMVEDFACGRTPERLFDDNWFPIWFGGTVDR